MKTKLITILLFTVSIGFAQGWRDKQGNPIPDNSWSKSIDGFGAQMLSVDEKAFLRSWNTPSESVGVTIVDKVHRGTEVIFPIIFAGCKKDMNGTCKLTGLYRVLKPDMSPYGNAPKDMTMFEGKPEAGYKLNLASNYIKIIFDPDDKAGKYTVRAKVTDSIARVSLELSRPIWLVDDNITIEKKPTMKKGNEKLEKPKMTKAQEELNQWITYGYRYPPSQDESHITALLQDEIFFKKPSSFLPLASFMTERFKLNDGYIAKNIPLYKKLRYAPLEVLIYALKMADTNATSIAYNELVKEIKDQRFIDFIKSFKPIDTVDLTIDTPGKIDIHWAAFMATGKEIYVKKIIQLLSLEEKGVENITLIGSARWSLLSNCKQHPKVLKICQEYRSKNSKIKGELKKLLKGIKK